MIGKTLAHYEITAEIGRGGMGEVYRARDTKLGREVALKLLPPDFAADPERLRRFEREARVLASLNHPNIATIHGFEHDGGHRFLVLELVEGADLSERLKRGPLPVREALPIALRIAEGMEAAHAKGIIHRDLKPANIKQTSDGSVKILDFGLARVHDNGPAQDDIEHSPTVTGHTNSDTLLGTAPYMSPEQLRSEEVDARADIWAFGCVVYQMLTGISPFAARTTPEIMSRILEHDPDWTKLPQDTPAAIARLLRRCLAKDPRQRLHSSADIRIVLQEAVEQGPDAGDAVAARDASSARAATAAPTTRAHPTSTSKRSWMLRTGVVAIVSLVVGALAATFLLKPQPDDVASGSGTVRLMIPVRDDNAVMALPESPSVAISPDGKYVVYVASIGTVRGGLDQRLSDTRLYLRAIDDFEATLIEGTAGAAAPFFSPNGGEIGFYDFDERVLKKVDVGGGIAHTICETTGIRGAHWVADGTIYFSDSDGILAVDANGGEPRTIIMPDVETGEKTYRFPHLLPGGKTLLLMRASSDILSYDEAEIVALDLASNEVRVLVKGGLDPQYIQSGHIVFGRAGKVFALPFDVERGVGRGTPVEVIADVVTSEGYGSLQLACANNGTLVYIAGGPEQFSTELMFLHRDGRTETIPQRPRPFGNLRLSPDFGRIVVSVLGANASLWIYELQRGIMTKLVSGWDNFAPVWTPSGDEISFGSNRKNRSGIWITASDGSGEPRELFDSGMPAYPNSWSPDGSSLAITRTTAASNLDIWHVSRDGAAAAMIASGAREARGHFSPDGRYVAYTSDESGKLEVYVQALPVTGRKWKLSEDGGDLPRWSREGDRVYYWSGQRLMMVDVTLQPDFTPARARQLLEATIEVHDYDVFPGGERFVVLGRGANYERAAVSIARGGAQGRLFPALSPDLRVVLNWFDELKRVAPAK